MNLYCKVGERVTHKEIKVVKRPALYYQTEPNGAANAFNFLKFLPLQSQCWKTWETEEFHFSQGHQIKLNSEETQ